MQLENIRRSEFLRLKNIQKKYAIAIRPRFAEDFSILSLLGSESGRSVFHATHNDDRWEYAVKRVAVDPG